jgi:hypothetical protein
LRIAAWLTAISLSLGLAAAQDYSGGWHEIAANDCIGLDYAGRATGYLHGTHPAGSVVWMRAISYPSKGSLGTVGDWKYLRFTT